MQRRIVGRFYVNAGFCARAGEVSGEGKFWCPYELTHADDHEQWLVASGDSGLCKTREEAIRTALWQGSSLAWMLMARECVR